uniref:Phospholipase A2-like central domain-containing protein n=1 Tax=Pelusios castaneus TaxID=367368 RepID=A0A8C8RGF6_9SAUR
GIKLTSYVFPACTNADSVHTRCCHAHDCCYGNMSAHGCNPKMEFYSYSIHLDQSLLICECDKAAVACFQKAASTYHRKYLYYPNMFCKGPAPPC